jgi:two-component system osmolarity sensor histidine kinase EnvZ
MSSFRTAIAKRLPRSLVARNALLVTLILITNQFLWFSLVRPAVFNRFVTAEQVHHPAGMVMVYLEIEWIVFSLITSTVGAYAIFFWLRRQLQDVVSAARMLGRGVSPPRLPETGPQEIRELSIGFNQLALNLETLEADRRLMLVGISHDLSTPLTRLRLGLELLQMRADPAQVPGLIHDVEEMNAILAQFSDFVRSGKDEQPASIDFNQVISEVCARYCAAGTPIRLELAPLRSFFGRPLALRRLVTNLIDNAARYGKVDVRVATRAESGQQLLLEVTDRGPGIQSRDPSSLVKPFEREDSARGGPSGAGLGLAIVDRIARAHGGALHLVNRSDGGLSATVALPYAS